jgi:methyl-accepting chemotaxis protein
MISSIVDIVLFAALLFTSIRVTKMHRELVRLRAHHGEFTQVLGKTNETVDDMVVMVREFSADGRQMVHALGDKIDEARRTIAEIDARAARPA